MGCLKLTCDYQEQGEKNDSLKWRVWINPNTTFLGVVAQENAGGGAGGFGGSGHSSGGSNTYTDAGDIAFLLDYVENGGDLNYLLPATEITDLREGNIPSWWGETQMFLDGNFRGADGSQGLQYSENLDRGLSVAGAVAGTFETGGAISLSQLTKGGNVVRLADQAKYLGALKYMKTLGNVGTGLSVAVALHEIGTGNDDTHTWVDLGVTGLGVGALMIGGTVAAPFVIVGGLGYGIWSLAGGSDWIDKNWGYNTSKSGGK